MKLKYFLLALYFIPSICSAEINNISVMASDSDAFKNPYIKNTEQLAMILSGQKKQVYTLSEATGLSATFIKTMAQRKGNLTTISYDSKNAFTCPQNKPCPTIQTQAAQDFEDAVYKLFTYSDSIVFLPGSFNVMYAFNYLQVLEKQKEINYKPIVFLNTNHYFERFRQMLVEMNRQKVISDAVFNTIVFENKPEGVLKSLQKTQQQIQTYIKQEKL